MSYKNQIISNEKIFSFHFLEMDININEGNEDLEHLCSISNKYNSTDEIADHNSLKINDEINPDIIKIYVIQPGIRIRYIRLNRNSPISILTRVYDKNSIYIYQGRILDTEKSFIDSNIKNHNKIVLIPSSVNENNPAFTKKWLILTSNQENFEDRIEFSMKRGNRQEIARLKDLRNNKLERKRSFLNKYLNNQNTKSSVILKKSKNYQLNIDYKKGTSPSINPLPIIW